ncbi:MAG: DUF4199 domain-containing protein [Prevotella sp.]|nr:DUF4199 domain-containing protein [Prevotella sp.]
MTAQEYLQLKAFARIDGAKLSLLWIASFALYIIGLTSPGYGLAALVLVLVTPFFVGSCLRHFRDDGLEGSISLLRGWAYTVFVFFYGGLLFALAQWAYLTYMDQGYLMKTITQMLTTPEATESLRQMGLSDALDESLQALGQMRPIDLSLNMLTSNILIGVVLGLPIAAVMQKRK